MAVLSLFLEREENAVSLLAPLLLRHVNTGRRCRLAHGAASVVARLRLRLSFTAAFKRRANLTRKLTEQTEDDRSWIMDMNWTCTDKKLQHMS